MYVCKIHHSGDFKPYCQGSAQKGHDCFASAFGIHANIQWDSVEFVGIA